MEFKEVKEWFESRDGTEINDLTDYYIDWLIEEVERLELITRGET